MEKGQNYLIIIKSILDIFNKIRLLLGLDKGIIYSVLAKILQAFNGLIGIFVIARFLSVEEQGYYYTFLSIISIQVCFELGLLGVITQYVAHEMALLKWASNEQLEGNQRTLSRLSSLLHFCIKAFSLIALILTVILIVIGFIFFYMYKNSSTITIAWEIPWIILSTYTSLSLIVYAILAFLEGLGKITLVAKIKILQQTVYSSTMIVLYLNGFKLYSTPLAAFCGLTVIVIYLTASEKMRLLKNIWKNLSTDRINYMSEIFPYQWKIAVSWISGYLMYQIFTPVCFAIEGAEVAGKIGITLAALNAILAIYISWMNTKVPVFSKFIVEEEYVKLDSTFNETLKRASIVCFLTLIALVVTIMLLKTYYGELGNRFLSLIPLILLCLNIFINFIVNSLGTYLRCHKKEPLLVVSIVAAILTIVSIIVMGKWLGYIGIIYGYFLVNLFVTLIWTIFIFYKKKLEWH